MSNKYSTNELAEAVETLIEARGGVYNCNYLNNDPRYGNCNSCKFYNHSFEKPHRFICNVLNILTECLAISIKECMNPHEALQHLHKYHSLLLYELIESE